MKLNLTPQQALYYYFNTRNYFNSHMVHCAHRVGHALCCSYSKNDPPRYIPERLCLCDFLLDNFHLIRVHDPSIRQLIENDRKELTKILRYVQEY